MRTPDVSALPPSPPPGAGVARRAGGLTSREATERLRRDGPNTLPPPRRRPASLELLAQLTHLFALMLWVASGLALVAGMPQLAVAIAVVVVVNGLFAFAQEARAEHAAERLRDLLPRRATVVRDGTAREVTADELVEGDLVLVGAGDRVCADMTLVEAHAVAVDTSLLTGESVPEDAGEGDPLLAGSFITSGEGAAVVSATGPRTRLGAIAHLTTSGRRPPSPLAVELHRVVRVVSLVAVAVGAGFFLLAVAVGTPASDGFLFGVGVTVALVPEGLLPTVTLSLAVGAQRMANRKALVRRLESVETLGAVTFICTDKTGTLTRNEMSVVRVWTPAGLVCVDGTGYEPDGALAGDAGAVAAARALARVGARCSSGTAVADGGRWVARGDPMEAALVTLARRAGVDLEADARTNPVTARHPFDSQRRRMSVVAGGELLVKGSPDGVLARCAPVPGALEAVEAMAVDGLRVLAVARGRPHPEALGPDQDEVGLELLGLAGFADPARAGVAEALAACRRAGIGVAMVTGDHPATAAAIARATGLATAESMVVCGADLPADDQLLGALVDRDGIVLARISPEDKLRIARALQARGHVVAMTGDGVNDGPALHEADIGVAMGASGTDVAREAADLVLLDDDFSTIVAAVGQGRATFANVRRFLTYHLTDNVAELTPFVVWALSGGRFPLAIGVLQVLCLDIGTDLLPALALGAEAPEDDTLRHPIVGDHLLDRLVLRRAFGVLGPTEALVEMAAFVVALMAAGWWPGEAFPSGPALAAASGAAFTAVVLGQMANAFACRSSSRPPWALGWATNRLLVGAVAVEGLALSGFLWVGPVADVLDHAPPPWAGWAVALCAPAAVLGADLADKAHRRRGTTRIGGHHA